MWNTNRKKSLHSTIQLVIRTSLLFLLSFQNKLFCSKHLFYSRLRQLNQFFQSWLAELVTLSCDSTIILSMVCKVLFLFCFQSTQDVQRTTAPSAGRNRKMRTLVERSHFNKWSASWYIASCHRFPGHDVISSRFLIWVIILQTWSKPIIENFKVLWHAQKLAY